MNDKDILTFEERDGMTIWGDAISAQVRHYDGPSDECMVLHVRDDAPRSPEDYGPVILGRGDVDKLRELLLEAGRREEEHSNNDMNIPE